MSPNIGSIIKRNLITKIFSYFVGVQKSKYKKERNVKPSMCQWGGLETLLSIFFLRKQFIYFDVFLYSFLWLNKRKFSYQKTPRIIAKPFFLDFTSIFEFHSPLTWIRFAIFVSCKWFALFFFVYIEF